MLAMASSHSPHGDPWGHRPAFLEPQLHHSGPPSLGGWPAPVENRTLPSIDTARGRPWEQQRSASNSPKTQQLPSVRSLLNPEQASLPPPQPSNRPVHSAGSVANNPHPLSLPSPPIPGLPSFRAMTSATYPTPAPTSSPRASDAPYTHFGSHHPNPAAAQEQRSPRDNESVSGPRSSSASRRRGGGGNRAPVRISRCIGQRHVPGEGLCFVYEDGSFCRTNIDGEPVNPSWGVTKAGKPRKRLAQACLTCREKKIKCEPSAGSKCVQCTKARRLCRGIHDQPSDQDPVSRSANPFKRRMTDFNSPSGGIAFLEDAAINQQGYRLKNMYENFPESRETRSPLAGPSADIDIDMEDRPIAVAGPAVLSAKESSFLASQQRYAAAWESDPYEDDADLTMRYLDLYFTHINAATYCMLPKDLFLHWVQTCKSKSADDRMLLYVLMTMGSVFSFRPEDAAMRQQLAKISAYAVERRSGHYTIQLAMSRLMMSLFNFARGKAFDAWDLNGAAYRSVSAVMYNMEHGIRQFMEAKPVYEFGLDRAHTEEVRRRVYWSAFIMDRYNGFCGGNLLAISSDDTHLQLPGPEASFEHGELVTGPLYDPDIPCFEPEATLSIGSQGHLAMISSIWGDVFTFTARTTRRLPKDFARLYDEYCVTTQHRAERWLSQLPQHLQWSLENLDASIEGGYAGLYISLYALYHITFLRLYRHTHLAQLSPQLVCRNIIRLRQHARAWVAIMCDMRKEVRDRRLAARRSKRSRSETSPPCATSTSATDEKGTSSPFVAAAHSHNETSTSRAPSVVPSIEGSGAIEFVFSTPFSGYTFLLSVDALTAGGRMRNLPDLKEQLQAALATVEELAQFWTAARAQVRAIRKRLEKLDDVLVRDEEERQQILEGEKRAGVKQEADASSGITNDVPVTAADDEDGEAVIDPHDLPPCWRLDAPLETAYAKSDDIMYGTPDAVFFRAALDEELLAT